MLRVSTRLTILLSVLAVLGWPAVARANHHHIGGSGSGGGNDPNADCLVWGYVVADGGAADRADGASVDADADAAMSDAGSDADAAQPVDAGSGDAGSGPPPGAVMVCLEHATLFGCDCSAGPVERAGWPLGAVVLVTAMLLATQRRRRAASRGGAR